MIKNGTKVKVIADTAFHGFKLGSTVTIIEKCEGGYPDNCYRAQSEDGAIRYISNKDFVVEPSTPYLNQKFYCVESYGSYFTEGKVYSVDSEGGMKYDDGYVGGNRESVEDYFNCNSWAKGKIYPLVDRTAKVGEYVYLKQDACCKAHLAGSVVKCVEDGGRFEGGKTEHRSGVYISMDRYSVIDGYTPKTEVEKETPKSKFVVGVKVRITGNKNGHCFRIGTIETITREYGKSLSSPYCLAWYVGNKGGNVVREDDMELYVETAKKPDFEVGMEVIVNGEVDGKSFKDSRGKIVKITTLNPPIGVEFDNNIGGHTCMGTAKNNYGFFVNKDMITFVKETTKKPEPIFFKGDRVVVKGSMGSRKFDNLVGTVLKDVENREQLISIEFDTNIKGHNCLGRGKEGYCYNVNPSLVSKHTYKVGDYVLLNGKSLGITWNNKTEKINNVDYSDNTLNVGSDYKWVDMKNAKPVPKPEIVRSIEIITEGTDTIAIYKENGVEVSRAVTKLVNGDTYNFFKGSTRAYINLIKKRKDSKSILKDLFDIMSGIFNPKPKIVKQDSYKVGDTVKIVDAWTGDTNENSAGKMDKWLGKTMTIRGVGRNYRMAEDSGENGTGGWYWNKYCIEGKVVK